MTRITRARRATARSPAASLPEELRRAAIAWSAAREGGDAAPLPLPLPCPEHRFDRHPRPGRGARAEVGIGPVDLVGEGVARGDLAENVASLLARGGDEIRRKRGELHMMLAGQRGERERVE